MNRKELHPRIVEVLKIYPQDHIKAANLILDILNTEPCKHKGFKRTHRTNNEYIYCFDCDQYIYYPESK